ncbi:MAG: hypothetical protein IMZ66_04605 [Planctomycetes bacterium]|nr:hypothetical protein [Planctomycetota bacterium]
MNNREKALAAVCGLAAVSLVTYMAINKVFIGPAADCEKQAADLKSKIERLETEKSKDKTHRARLANLARATYGTDEMRVTEQVRTRVTEVITLSGLSSQNLSMKPMIGSRVPGVYKEIGWTVRARGKLGQVISFLYLMSKEPHLHRLDNVILSPVPASQEVELQAKYATLLLEAPKGEKLVTGEVDELITAALLETPDRERYNVIATRDLFRPYIPGQPKPAEAPPETPRVRPEAPPPRTPDSRYRLVGLPLWGGKADVLIRDASSGKIAKYTSGDEFAGGRVVTVDYRPMPSPNNPEILSMSRVVLQIGGQYYALELGATLAEKHTLSPDQLPPGLPKLEPVPAPATTPPVGPAHGKQ